MQAQLPSVNFAEQYDTVDFNQFLGTLKRRAGTIAFFTLVVTAAVLVHVLFAQPEFTAQGVLYLGETQDNGGGDVSGPVDLGAYSMQSDVETQIGLLTTGTLIQQAVLETGLNATLRPVGTPPLTYWRWEAFAHGDTSVFVPGQNDLQVVNATLPGRYRIVTTSGNGYKLYPWNSWLGGGVPLLTGTLGVPAAAGPYALTVQAATGPVTGGTQSTEVPAGITYDLTVVPPDVLAGKLTSGMLTVTAGGAPTQPTKLATLQLKWHDPYQAKQFVNQLMYDYITTQLQWKTQAASVTESFVTGQIANVAGKLAKADEALSEYQAQTGLVDPQQNAQVVVQQMAQLQSQRATLLLQQQALQQLHDSFKSANTAVSPFLLSQMNDPVLSALTTSLSDALVKLKQLNVEYTPNAQDVKVQEAQVSELRGAIDDVVKNDLSESTENLKNIDNLIAAERIRTQDQPAETLQVNSLERASDQLAQFYGLLTEKAEQAEISKAATIIGTRIVTPSQLPRGATSPRAKIALVGGVFAGFFLGVIVVFLQHTLSGRYESEEQIRRTIKLPIYGTIPRQKLVSSGNSLFGPKSRNSFSEAFQLIKRNIVPYTRQDRATAILVISANERDGKTTIAVNLAKTLADDGKRVVMIDCDFYLSRLHKFSEFRGVAGLTDWLATGERPALMRWPDETFWVLPAGALPKRSGRMDESALAAIINLLTEEFDYLVLDSPPLPIVSDGLVLGNFSDIILSVVNIKNTSKKSFVYHNELVEALDRPHGLIINGAETANYAETEAYFIGAIKSRRKFAGWFDVR